jgi:YHS domain-containing protein
MKLLTLSLLAVWITTAAIAQHPTTRSQNDNLDNGVAVKGYDPVAYFAANHAVEGKKDIAYVYAGATYRFATTQNRELFKSDPEKYLPQYGGWCAYAMGASAEKVDVDPETFKLVQGKLYLFYNRFFNNTKKLWDKDEASLKTKADSNWQKLNN